MKSRFYKLFVLLYLFTAGCGIKSVSPAADTYTILPVWDSSRGRIEAGNKSSSIIKLAPVRGSKSFSSTELLYTDTSYGLNSYAYSRWSDAPVRLLQTLFQVAMEESGLFMAVVPPTSASEVDLLLESTLLDLSHHMMDDGTSEGVVRVRFHLIKTTEKTVTATKELVSKVPATSQDAQGAAAALNKAATNVARNLVSWLSEPGRL